MEPAHSETGDCRVARPASILVAGLSMWHLIPLMEFNHIRDHALAFRLKPRALRRETRVVGFMPSRAAAPAAPKTFPPVCSSATVRFSRSRCLSSAYVRTAVVSAGLTETVDVVFAGPSQ